MDEGVGVGVGPAERAPHAGGGGPTPTRRRRMSAGRRREAVLRLLRGEDLELVSRELGVTAAELSGWREAFLAAGEASLRSRPADARDAEIGRLKAKVGELTWPTSCSGPRSASWGPAALRPDGGRGDGPPGLALRGEGVRGRAGHAPAGRRAGDRLPPPPPGWWRASAAGAGRRDAGRGPGRGDQEAPGGQPLPRRGPPQALGKAALRGRPHQPP